MTLHIRPDGAVDFIHSDDLQLALADQGRARIRRASHVEPDDDGRWWADLSPVAGPKLGPFSTRAAGLAAELEWLEQRLAEGALPQG
jgi:hypothetical protein